MVTAGFTMMLAVVTPVLHEYMAPPLAVKAVLEPLQMVTKPGETDAEGSECTVTVREAEAVQPLASVTVTE